jgi:chemotaxis protein methyltransferase CheR
VFSSTTTKPLLGSFMIASVSSEYKIFSEYLAAACGIVLGENKQYLVSSRLSQLMIEFRVDTLGALVDLMQQTSQRHLKQAVLDAMTTNETLWFRDTHPFNVFRDKLLPEFQRDKKTSVKVWSAACSSGQEPYSLSMLVDEYKRSRPGALNCLVDILATDLSASMIETCKLAEYDELSLGRGLSTERRQRFFNSIDEKTWCVNSDVQQRIRFQSLNLMDSFASLGKFEVVFCRNVLIYFSAELKADILHRIHTALRPGGYLVLGASEGLADLKQNFKMVQCNPGIIYQAV